MSGEQEPYPRNLSSPATSSGGDATEAADPKEPLLDERTDLSGTSSPPSSAEALSKGISSTLASVLRDFDSRAIDAVSSQDLLSSAIDRLTGELDQLLEDAPVPFIMQHAAKISGVTKRVSSLNSLLKSIQQRIDNIDRILYMGSQHDKTTN